MNQFKYLKIASLLLALILYQNTKGADIYFYFHNSYNLSSINPYAKDSIKLLIEQHIKNKLGESYTIDIIWLNYSDALDFSNEKKPGVALLTTGMYCNIYQLNPNKVNDINVIGVVNRFGTTSYKYFVLLKKGYTLSPRKVKGKMAIKKKQSLSGSLFSLNYLIEYHGFPKGLLSDDKIRSEWAQYEKYHAKLDTLKASSTNAILYCGEGIDSDREKIEQNGWQIFPKLNENASKFEITRSLLMVKNLDSELRQVITELFINKTEVGKNILRLINVDDIEPFSPAKLNKVIEEYNRILSPKTGFERLVIKIQSQLGLYILSVLLLVLSHLVFRYKIAQEKDTVFWIILVLIIKLSVFICEIWFVEPSALYFFLSALLIGSLDKNALKKIIQKLNTTIINV